MKIKKKLNEIINKYLQSIKENEEITSIAPVYSRIIFDESRDIYHIKLWSFFNGHKYGFMFRVTAELYLMWQQVNIDIVKECRRYFLANISMPLVLGEQITGGYLIAEGSSYPVINDEADILAHLRETMEANNDSTLER